MKFLTVLNVLILCAFSIVAADPYQNFDGWRRFKTAEYLWCPGCSRFSFFEISWGKIDGRLGRGIGGLDILWVDEEKVEESKTVYILLPIRFYAAFPLGDTPRFKTDERAPGKIVIIPKEGMFQYPACLHFNTSLSFISFYDCFREFALSYRLSAAFEKSLPFQNFVSIEAGYWGLFLPEKQKNEGFLYAGISIGVLSNWKRIDI